MYARNRDLGESVPREGSLFVHFKRARFRNLTHSIVSLLGQIQFPIFFCGEFISLSYTSCKNLKTPKVAPQHCLRYRVLVSFQQSVFLAFTYPAVVQSGLLRVLSILFAKPVGQRGQSVNQMCHSERLVLKNLEKIITLKMLGHFEEIRRTRKKNCPLHWTFRLRTDLSGRPVVRNWKHPQM